MTALATTNLSLNDIHVEVGGTTNTECSLNDTDIRGITSFTFANAGSDGIDTTADSEIAFGEFRGADSDAKTFIITKGSDGNDDSGYVESGRITGITGYGSLDNTKGWGSSGFIGAKTNDDNGKTILYVEGQVTQNDLTGFEISGGSSTASDTGSGADSYSYISGSDYTFWIWDTLALQNAMGAESGTTRFIKLTPESVTTASKTFTITIGNDGDDTRGYKGYGTTFGSISPDDVWGDSTILEMSEDGDGFDMWVSGNVSASTLTGIVITGNSTFTSSGSSASSVVYFSSTNRTRFSWNQSSAADALSGTPTVKLTPGGVDF